MLRKLTVSIITSIALAATSTPALACFGGVCGPLVTVMPAQLIRIIGGSPGIAPLEGTLLPLERYRELFNLLGTTYGGDGRTTFGLPDMRARLCVPTPSKPKPAITPDLQRILDRTKELLESLDLEDADDLSLIYECDDTVAVRYDEDEETSEPLMLVVREAAPEFEPAVRRESR